MKKKFNPKDWLPTNEASLEPQPSNHPANQPSNISDDIELVVSRIEAACIDITGSYADWLNIGFALADEFGESGRSYYQRISRFYSGYSMTDCNKQFDQCIKAKGHGITIKTVFHLAKQAGIDLRSQEALDRENGVSGSIQNPRDQVPGSVPPALPPHVPEPDPDPIDLPTLPDSVFAALPDLLQRVIAVADSNEERDILLLGSLVSMSACLPKVYGIYDGKKVYTNLYLFVTAQASAGKGRLVHCKQLVKPVHIALRQQAAEMKQQYEIELRDYNIMKGKDCSLEKPVKPPERMLFIPANNSTTGVFQLLSDNDGKGLMFETEGDTLAQAFKTDYGNYSDGFRKAFHHETISYYRRTDHEYVEIDHPCLSTVLSGTPKQVSSLIPNAENGLFSRFIFYHMNIKPVWKNVFKSNCANGLEEYFDRLGQDFLPLYSSLNSNQAIQFCLTAEQEDAFHTFFTQVQEKYLLLQGLDYMATVRRLGLIAFRLAMVLSTVRLLESGDFSDKQVCTEADFQCALSMIKILIKHSSHVFSELPEDVKPSSRKNKKEQFLEQLPLHFDRKGYLDLAKRLGINEKTAEGYIAKFCEKGLVFREQQGNYINLTIAEE